MVKRSARAAAVSLAVLCFAVLAPKADSAAPLELAGCSTLSDAIERPDGSIVAVGTTGECPRLGNLTPESKTILANFTGDGSSGSAFGGEIYVGVPSASGEWAIELVARSDGGFYLVTNRRVLSYLADGELDSAFGNGGQIFPTEGQVSYSSVQDAELDSDGSILVAAGIYGDLRLSRYERDGSLSETFGIDGVATLDLSGGAAIEVDPEGRIIAAATNGLARLDSQGNVDLTFGEGGTGYAELPSGLPFYPTGIFEVNVEADDKIRVAGVGYAGLYSDPGFLAALGPDGQKLPGETPITRGNRPGEIVSYPGGFAYTSSSGRGSSPTFLVGTFSRPQPTPYLVSPGDAYAAGIASMSDGSLLVVGSSGGANCVSQCEFFSSMAMAKVDPETGDLVESFGVKGTRWVQPNKCSFGQTGQISEWNVCRVKQPAPAGSIKFRGVRDQRPSVTIFARLGSPPGDLWGTKQRFDITLPKMLKLRGSGLSGKIVASVRPEILADQKVKVKGRRVSVLVEPGYQPYNGEWGPIGEDKTIRIRVRIRPGALARISKPKRLKRMKFGLKGTFVPVAGGVALASSRNLWFSPNSGSVRISVGEG